MKMTDQIEEPPTRSYVLGDGINWRSPLNQAFLYVELPFWLMVPAGAIQVEWSGARFTVDVCPPWQEVFAGEVTDSRRTVIDYGPQGPDMRSALRRSMVEVPVPSLPRPCKTMLRLTTRAHSSAFESQGNGATASPEQEAYRASLCRAHIPVVNEVIQRYRLETYDFFAYEVSPWDVPVWYVKFKNNGFCVIVSPYKQYDRKPEYKVLGSSSSREFQYSTPVELSSVSTSGATPGEFDLLDAWSLIERGDYTGAVRRTVTAIEAVTEWALRIELEKQLSREEVDEKLANTEMDFPGRLRQLNKLRKPPIAKVLIDAFQRARKMRNDIVHRGRRISDDEHGDVERVVDTTRWLYNKIEAREDRASLRDKHVQKSMMRAVHSPQFPSVVDRRGITLKPLLSGTQFSG
jgi:hypothetical protein